MANKLAWLTGLVFAGATYGLPLADGHENGTYVLVYKSMWRTGIDPRLTIQAPDKDSISTVTMPPFDGTVLKVTMRRSDYISHKVSGVPRAEVVFAPVARFAPGHEYEVRWTTMIPSSYPIDSLQPEIITQVHHSSSVGSPPFSLMLAGAHYQVDVRGGLGTPSRSYTFGAPLEDEGKVVAWVLRYRPDDQGQHALTDLYKDGVLVVHSAGKPNAYPNDKNAYLKIGVYKWWWNTRPSDVSERTMYYGNVEIGEQLLASAKP
ncbi:heparin lyase I family protein [Paraburkholderia megapolitana]|uniref:Polysaccharide lyase n=1 Tax=Paraburkholderia megapolitana TaxID=420953 RepID=A0A1I3DLV4_9BURK|nr:heparin lyase I family protein [Paraburkholderia megapolitana]QDQ81919.1 hypothetical protein FNZ07_12585 [Paraburkholderia megapolitana]SFH87508.1 Polysaccharide lyase [Paraburkholderia megapolitana]